MDKRYIDIDRLCEWLKNLKSGFTKDELVFRDELVEHLRGNNGIANVLPAVDVVEVVRCKDCKYHRSLDGGVRCERMDGLLMTLPSDFCSYGKR